MIKSSQALGVATSVDLYTAATAKSPSLAFQASDTSDASVLTFMAVTLKSTTSAGQVTEATTRVFSSVVVTVDSLHSTGKESDATTSVDASMALSLISSRSESQATYTTTGFDSSRAVTSKVSSSASQTTDTTTDSSSSIAVTSKPLGSALQEPDAVTTKFSTSVIQATRVDPSISQSLRSAGRTLDATLSVFPSMEVALTTTSSATKALDAVKSVASSVAVIPESSNPASHTPGTSPRGGLFSTTFESYIPEATTSFPHFTSMAIKLSISVGQAPDSYAGDAPSTTTASISSMVRGQTLDTAGVTSTSLSSASQKSDETSRSVSSMVVRTTSITFVSQKSDASGNVAAFTAVPSPPSYSVSQASHATTIVAPTVEVTSVLSPSSSLAIDDSKTMRIVTLEPSTSLIPVLSATTSDSEETQPSSTTISIAEGATLPAPCSEGGECTGKMRSVLLNFLFRLTKRR